MGRARYLVYSARHDTLNNAVMICGESVCVTLIFQFYYLDSRAWVS